MRSWQGPKELGISEAAEHTRQCPGPCLGEFETRSWEGESHFGGGGTQQVRRDRIQSACEKALRGWGLGKWLQRTGVGT